MQPVDPFDIRTRTLMAVSHRTRRPRAVLSKQSTGACACEQLRGTVSRLVSVRLTAVTTACFAVGTTTGSGTLNTLLEVNNVVSRVGTSH